MEHVSQKLILHWFVHYSACAPYHNICNLAWITNLACFNRLQRDIDAANHSPLLASQMNWLKSINIQK